MDKTLSQSIDDLIALLEKQNKRDRIALSAIGRWLPISEYDEAKHGRQVLICGGTVRYDAETFPSEREFYGVGLATKRDAEWWGGFGAEHDGQFWHKPEYFQPVDRPVSALAKAEQP